MASMKFGLWLLAPVALMIGYLWGRTQWLRTPIRRTSAARRDPSHASEILISPTMSYVDQPLDVIRRAIGRGRISTIKTISTPSPTPTRPGHESPAPYLYVFADLLDGTGMALDAPTRTAVDDLLHAVRQYNVVVPPDKQVVVQATL